MTNLQYLFFLIFLIFTCHINEVQSQGWSFSYRTNHIQIDQACQRGREAAINDFVLDQNGFYFFGLPNPRFNTWKRMIQKHLRLTSKGGGCILHQEGICYNDFMRILLKGKYGISIFEEINARVDSLYNVGLGDRLSFFKNGFEDINGYLYCNIDQPYFSIKDTASRCILKAIIDQEGIISLDTLYFKNTPNHLRYSLDKKIKELICKMPTWSPTIEEMNQVSIAWNIPILFTERERRKWCK